MIFINLAQTLPSFRLMKLKKIHWTCTCLALIFMHVSIVVNHFVEKQCFLRTCSSIIYDWSSHWQSRHWSEVYSWWAVSCLPACKCECVLGFCLPHVCVWIRSWRIRKESVSGFVCLLSDREQNYRILMCWGPQIGPQAFAPTNFLKSPSITK